MMTIGHRPSPERFLERVSGTITFRTGQARAKTGRDPPPHPWLQLLRRPARGSFRVRLQCICDQRHAEAILPREFAIGSSGNSFVRRNRVVNVVEDELLRSARDVVVHLICDRIIGEAQVPAVVEGGAA